MAAQIRPTRLEINDRFPMLGFTIRTDGTPQRAEVAIATDPGLLSAQGKTRRTTSNFYSSRAAGPLSIPRGEAVYVVPPEVLARFVGAQKIYFGLATAPAGNGAAYQVASMPTDGSPYVSLQNLTDRSLRRVRLIPNRQQRAAGYGDNSQAGLDWAGDAVTPGTEPAAPMNGKAANGAPAPTGVPAAPAPYDDGFGPMHPAAATPPPAASPTDTAGNGFKSSMPPAPAAQGLSRAFDVGGAGRGMDVQVSASKVAVTPPESHLLSDWQRGLLLAGLSAIPGGLGTLVSGLKLAAETFKVSIGIGPGVSGGFGAGAGLGVGLIFGPNGELGVYGATELDLGLITSISATVQVTIVNGGIDAFSGWSYAAAVSGGEELVGGAAALFNDKDEFQGVSLQLGIGAGLSPIDVYIASQKSSAVQLALSQGYNRPVRRTNGAVRAMDVGGAGRGPDVQVSPDKTPVTPPDTHVLEGWQRTLLMGALQAMPGGLGMLVTGLKLAAETFKVSIGFGPAVGAGFMSGGGLGVGLIFGRDGELGAYGTAELDVGFITSLSAVLQVTVVNGGIDAFNGWSTAAAITGGEEIVGGAAALFNENGQFQGVSVQAGVGVGLSPVDVYLAAQKSTAVQLGLSQGLSRLPARRTAGQKWSKTVGARSLDDDPLAIDIKYRMFIPSPLIDSPFTVFGGDGRTFSYSDGESRGEIQATVRLTEGGGIASVDVISAHWGESSAWNTSDSYHPDGKPSWWLEKKDGAQPTETKTLQRTTSNLNITAGGTTAQSAQTVIEGSSVVTISAAGALPLSSVAPDIDATMAVFLRINGGLVEAKVDGTHDGFPCHELYVNGTRLYAYDPVAAGNGPDSLMPPEDITARTDWETVAVISVNVVPSQGLGVDAFSINWDDVDLLAQPTDMGCWATSGAMVVGWRDRKSIMPSAIAERCGLQIVEGLDPTNVQQAADALGLIIENPACYTIEGFRNLLENYGPLWIGAAVPSLHVVVVTGMYSDGTQTFVRISDPWDRVVGTPGSPGGALDTHSTGSRYIMTYDAFQAEYELAGMQLPPGSLQIIHCTSADLFGRTPNRGDASGAGYAQGLAAPARRATPAARAFDTPMLAGLQFAAIAWNVQPPNSLNRETDESLPADQSAAYWRGLLTQLVGQATATKLQDLPAMARDRGWTVALSAGATPGVALVSAIGSGLAIDPQGGVFSFGIGRLDGGTPADPFEPRDMAAVTGGSPQVTILEGDSGKLMTWARAVAFRTQDKRVRNGAALLAQDGTFVGATFQLEVNGLKAEDVLDAVKVGYAQAPARFGTFIQPLSLGAASPRRLLPRGLADEPGPAPGTVLSRVAKEQGGVRFDLAQLAGLVSGQTTPMVAVNTPLPGRRIVLNDWPYLDGPSGRTHGDISIDWAYAAGSVGNIVTDLAAGESFDGCALTVTTSVVAAASPDPVVAALTICARYVFSRAGQPDEIAVTEVTVFGDGREPQRRNRQEQPVSTVGA